MATKASKEADKLSRELSDPTALSRTAPTPIQSEDMKEIRRVADTPAIIEAREAVVDAPLTGGRPAFETYTDRFVWAIENDDWNEKDQKLADKYPEAFEMAQNRVKKVG